MKRQLSLSWNLDSLFTGGSSSVEFATFVEELKLLTIELLKELQVSNNNGTLVENEQLTKWTAQLQKVLAQLREADSFVSCLTSQQMSDKRAIAWTETIQTLSAKYRQALDLYEAHLSAVPEDRFNEWSQQPEHTAVIFPLNERRESAKEKLPPAQESVASELAINGYHGWGEHYNTIVGRITIPWEEEGHSRALSVSQADNLLDDPNPEVRARMSALWEQAWADEADLCADTLNRLAGFRLKLYGMRKWKDPLREPLRMNRMSANTLSAMWNAVEEGMEPLKRYLQLKARRMGKEKLSWHDVNAPIATSQVKIPYDEAALLITDAFSQFSPDMAKLAQTAFEERWIEAEDRTGKRPGGFCTSFPLSRQSRIFMTYSGTPSNVSTLAHELGHAYHGALVEDLPPLAQEYAMNVAETASTFAEALVNDALLRRAEGDEEKLALLDDRLQRAVAFCMNIRARFLFETRFYDRRASGMLEVEELNQLMQEAQKEAFGDSLSSWHPHFWAAKLHFYLTDVPFYNFPYTFGYLFSTGLVAVAEREGVSFSGKYDRLLKDTGVMTVEQLGQYHLGVALDEPQFWKDAIARIVADVDAFAALCKE